ncbi:MAG: PadR family transcriptional regulator [Ignisphaera sp.]
MVRRTRYSWLKNLVLSILSNGDPMHGYMIYKRIEDAVGVRWKPSIGTFYRLLARLRDDGLINCFKQNRRTVCRITDRGIEHIVNEVLTHLPKFIGVLNEILSAYLYIVRMRSTGVDPYIRERIEKLFTTANSIINIDTEIKKQALYNNTDRNS